MTAYNGHLYAIYPFVTPQIWLVADTHIKLMSCCGVNGHLVTITDAAEKNLIASLAPVSTTGVQAPWIGLSEDAVEGTLAWTTGEPYDPTLLSFGVFNSGANDYACTYVSGGALVTNMESISDVAAGAIVEFDCP
jgi:Lectin C-type domain